MENKTDNGINLRFLAEPGHVNFGGKVHGGSVMKWIDQAGYVCAVNWSGQYAVTVYVGGIRFYKPISIGELIDVEARVIYTGTTSMHVAIDVYAGNPKQQQRNKTTHCVIVFVAVDDQGKPVHVPKFSPVTEEEIAMEAYAKRLMDLRKGIDEEMSKYIDPA
ncbi:acyl-CoA thioesterase [Chitinophaga skermanii]|nr:acyl-CoA thioesterase [Chitinophaga skermanii]